ncbi:SAM-dependent methyltransferase [Streptomyces sp. B6B3]|uniref:SAM-dependent methyltransferase n=1 Tax=Streptomyces sp. B6B3 TaxID=3153570 RepID=UPI00325C72A4
MTEPAHPEPVPVPPGVDPDVPHSARFWDALLGGRHHFAADQAAAELFEREHPVVGQAARSSRRFLVRAVRHLVLVRGIRQILDIGPGLPTANNTHEIAQAADPSCRVVYVDNDPVVLAHARGLLSSTPEGATEWVLADVRDHERVHDESQQTLNHTRPVAVIMLSMLGHLDPEEAVEVVGRYTEPLVEGSCLVVGDETDTPAMRRAADAYAATGAVPYHVRTREQIAATATGGMRIQPPGVVPLDHWPAPEPGSGPPADVDGYVAVKERPGA